MPFYQSHALADLFPLIEGAEFDELVKSIRDHGLREPITLYNGLILDGRNRYRACDEALVEPRFEEFTGDDPYAFVADKNLHRRHLNPSQLGMIGARMARLELGSNQHTREGAETSAPSISQAQAAEILNISRDTIQSAKIVLNEGTAEEIHAVEQGKRGVNLLAQEIRERNPRDRNEDRRGIPLARTAKLENKLKTQQINAKLWQELRGALLSIGNLPKASDMAVIARNVSRGDTVDQNLAHAIIWLTEFQISWNANKKDAA